LFSFCSFLGAAFLDNLLAVTVILDGLAKQLSLNLVFLAHGCLGREYQGCPFVGSPLLRSASPAVSAPAIGTSSKGPKP
jgi:hypothetical protein